VTATMCVLFTFISLYTSASDADTIEITFSATCRSSSRSSHQAAAGHCHWPTDSHVYYLCRVAVPASDSMCVRGIGVSLEFPSSSHCTLHGAQ